MVVPPDFKIIISVNQHSWVKESPSFLCSLSKLATATTRFVKERLEEIEDYGKVQLFGYDKTVKIVTSSELTVLRLLRHVREEIDGIKLRPENLEFWFDSPDGEMVQLDVTEDGDFEGRVPGGFFTQRVTELF